MKNVFIVKSPLQLLNAMEARCHFELDFHSCVLIIMGDKKSFPQMLNLVKENDAWGMVFLLDNIPVFVRSKFLNYCNGSSSIKTSLFKFQKSSFFSVLKLNKLAYFLKEAGYLFVGDNHNPLMRHFINRLKHRKTVLLDDGVGAVYMASIRKKRHHTTPDIKLNKKIKLMAKRFFQRLNDRQVDEVSFFSAYNLDLSEKDELVHNDYRCLNNKKKSLDRINDVYFLGTPFSEVGVMSEGDYLRQLNMVREKYNNQVFKYISHRRESPDKLKKIENEMGIEVIAFNYPIEYQLAMIGPVPKILTSFVTSALENLRIIMRDDLKIIAYRLIDGSYSIKDRIDSIYDSYEENEGDFFYTESLCASLKNHVNSSSFNG